MTTLEFTDRRTHISHAMRQHRQNLRAIKTETCIHPLILMCRIAQRLILGRFHALDLMLAPVVREQPQGLEGHGVGAPVEADVVGRGDPLLAGAVKLGARADVVAALAVDVVGGPGRDPAEGAAGFEGFGGGGVALEGIVVIGGWEGESAGAQAEEEGGEDVHVAISGVLFYVLMMFEREVIGFLLRTELVMMRF